MLCVELYTMYEMGSLYITYQCFRFWLCYRFCWLYKEWCEM